MLSFLLDAGNWPSNAYPFKRTSLILHLLNGVLLATLLRQLGLTAYGHVQRNRVEIAAVVGAAFWLLHPLFVSTTLYVVQREAMLPATFTLLGIMLWLHGRCAFQRNRTMRGLFWAALGLGLCTALALLSKANGILLPALALSIEYTLLRHAPEPATPAAFRRPALNGAMVCSPAKEKWRERSWERYRWTLSAFAWMPSAFVVAYLLNSAWIGFMHGVSDVRPWTMGQRLLTEPRVIIQYLDRLWLPHPFTPGLFNDQLHASSSMWSPLTTLPALSALLCLIFGCWVFRKRWPALALAGLFFFVGQSIESSTIPLELYFEHRNYLPAMLMFWPLALWLCGVKQSGYSPDAKQADKPKPSEGVKLDWLRCMLALILIITLALMTHANAQLWGNTRDQSELWATINPDSPRAQTNAALHEMADGYPLKAIQRLNILLHAEPNEVQLALNLVTAHCMLGRLSPIDFEQARHAMANTRDPGALLLQWFEGSIPAAAAGQCQGLSLPALSELIDVGLANSKLAAVGGRRQDLLHLKGHLALARNDPANALHYFDISLDQDVRPGAAMEQAAMLGSAGYPREGLAHLDHYVSVQHLQALPEFGMPLLHALVLRHQNYWPNEMTRLRDTLQRDTNATAESDK